MLIPVTLFGIFLTVGGSHLPLENSNRSCNTRLYECSATVDHYTPYMRDLGHHLSEILTENFVNQMCSDFQGVVDCEQDVLQTPGCALADHRSDQDKQLPRVWANLWCDARTMTLVLAAQNSPCASDEVLADQMLESLRNCRRAISHPMGSPEEECRAHAAMVSCFQTVTSRMCGQPLGDLALHIWDDFGRLFRTTGVECP